jgi:uncharacterized protein (DUF362 family)/Pyruvate/2-oxoacid:ferredoxin oxidoreductase delta subunit
MNNVVAVRKCEEYDYEKVYRAVSEIYEACGGPDVSGSRVLLKPNVLTDEAPERCITTHPVVFEAMVRMLQQKGATVIAGDSPAVHLRGFRPVKSGLSEVCERTGIEWIDFTTKPAEIKLKNGKIKVASAAIDADIIISMPKFKNHELVYFTGAVKNTLGLVPGFTKAKQHALFQNRESFSRFLVDLSEAVTPQFFLIDGIMGMEGPGPGQGYPFRTGVLIGSTNPVALDIAASTVAGYDPLKIPTNRIALERQVWLKSAGEISYNGPLPESLVKKDFKRIPITPNRNVSWQFIKRRMPFLRRFDRRPDFIHSNCTGCRECIKICPENAIVMHPEWQNWVVLTDNKCIRCFCCSEVCKYHAVKIRVKVFGA